MASEAGTPVLPTALPMTGVAAGAINLKVGDFPDVTGSSVSVQSTAGRNSGKGWAFAGGLGGAVAGSAVPGRAASGWNAEAI